MHVVAAAGGEYEAAATRQRQRLFMLVADGRLGSAVRRRDDDKRQVRLRLSGEEYIAADGNVYEKIGLKPDEEVLISKYRKQEDPVLERAVDILRKW